MMRFTLLTFLATISISVLGQEGSNIEYIRIYEINKGLLNKEIKIDFKPRLGDSNIRNEDTVELKINGANIRLVEKRKVGADYWYYDDQYLQPIDQLNGNKIKIYKTEVKDINSEAILFELFIEFYTKDDKKIKTETKQIWIDRKSLDGIMIKRSEG